MTNKVMLDSSILVEYLKASKTKLLDELLSNADTQCFINETVVSEFLYYFLALNGGKSPRSIQSTNEIKHVFESSSGYIFLNSFTFLPSDDTIVSSVPALMKQYNLLPNDAIILATCKLYNIPALASHDSDFKIACHGEGISFITEN